MIKRMEGNSEHRNRSPQKPKSSNDSNPVKHISPNSMIGEGTYGRVYRSKFDGKNVAIKKPMVPKTSDFLFSLRELDTSKRLEHNGIVKLISFKTERSTIKKANSAKEQEPEDPLTRHDSLVLIYELAKSDLHDAVIDIGPFKEHKAKNVIVQLLLATRYMHSQDYIHRDIKPANILYFTDNIVKICDFGVSKVYCKYDTHDSRFGSPLFRAPELLSGGNHYPYDQKIDVWSIGCVMHFLITGDNIPMTDDRDSLSDEDYTVKQQLKDVLDGLPDLCRTSITMSKFNAKYKGRVINQKLYNSLLFAMLAVDPSKRLTCNESLQHKYFSEFASVISIDTKMCESKEHINKETPNMMFESTCSLHSLLTPLILDIFVNNRKEYWYSDRMLFMSIAILDKMVYISQGPELDLDLQRKKCLFKSCLYISAKYYYMCHEGMESYETFMGTEYSFPRIHYANDFEDYILKKLDYKIYLPTIYDCFLRIREPTYEDVFSMLLFVLTSKHKNKTPSESLTEWLSRENSFRARVMKNSMYNPNSGVKSVSFPN